MANITEIEQVRRKIGDSLKSNTEIIELDGSARLIQAKYKNIDDVVLSIAHKKLVNGKDYVVNQKSGQITLSQAPQTASTAELTYSYSGYLNSEIEALISNYGVLGATVECLNSLLVDSAKFYDYSQGQTSDKRSQIFEHLKELLAKAEKDAGVGGGEVVFGKRHPEDDSPRPCRIDLSRTDRWSSNNC
jgi:hypothetical protein|nr:MAG TPA: hypothetical protein [Caudoviricetes sp.]